MRVTGNKTNNIRNNFKMNMLNLSLNDKKVETKSKLFKD